MVNKIKISKISEECFQQKGFDEKGCFNCSCNDSCCRYGADFDKESYDLVLSNKNLIEPLIKMKIENCFEKEFSDDKEFLGNNSIRSLTGKNSFCVFHNSAGKGCVLYNLVNQNKINKRIVPSICRLFPLSWGDGQLYVSTDEESCFPKDCNCLHIKNVTSKSIFETQKNEMDDIFNIEVK
ncbi:MAG: hypothetical protein ABIH82_01065 [Candidatus Woesearchaeota archaeon]